MADEPNTPNQPTPPQGTDEEERITRIAGQLINRAITSRFSTFEKQFGDKINASIAETIKSSLAGHQAPEGEGGEGKGGRGGKSVEIATLQRRLDEVEGRAKQFEAVAKSERDKNRANSLYGKTTGALLKLGVDPGRMRHAFAFLQQEGRLGYETDDSDDVLFTDDVGVRVGLDVGLAAWAKSEDAKIFLPPTGAKGSGSRPGNAGQQTMTAEEARNHVFNRLAQGLREQG